MVDFLRIYALVDKAAAVEMLERTGPKGRKKCCLPQTRM